MLVPYFFTLPHKRHSFPKIITEYKICVSIFSTTFIGNISHWKKNSARYTSSSEVLVILVVF